MKTFNLVKDPYDEKVNIFSKSTVTLEPGVTVLIGCNGFGKTTFLKLIKKSLDKEKIKYIIYDNLHDGGSNSVSKAAYYNDFTFIATAICSSEGEQIMMNLEQIAQNIGKYVRSNPNQNEYFILLDAVDSGFSIDNIVELKEYLFNTVIEDCNSKSKDVYIIVSANEYEMCNGEKCLDIYTGKYREFKTYNAYRNFILRSRKIKDKRNDKKS